MAAKTVLKGLRLVVALHFVTVPVYATTSFLEAQDGVTVWTGNSGSELDESQIAGIVGLSPLSLSSDARFGAAPLSTTSGVDSAARARRVIFTANEPGFDGHNITVALAVTVYLATNAAGDRGTTGGRTPPRILGSTSSGGRPAPRRDRSCT